MSTESPPASSLALEWKERGNAYYAQERYDKALQSYQWGLEQTKNGNSSSDAELALALRNNLAMTYLKLENYAAVVEETTRVLQLERNNTKALYRRALAREKSRLVYKSLHDQKRCLIQAMDDIQRCLEVTTNGTQAQRDGFQKVLDRLEQSVQLLFLQEQETTATPSTPPTTKSNDGPDIVQQKEDVRKLLLARQKSNVAPAGEAFFLVQWKWWCQWCRHASVVQDSSFLRLLLPGAIVPAWGAPAGQSDNGSKDDDDSTSTSSSDTSILGLPGPIDNSSLMLEDAVFQRQWYNLCDNTNEHQLPLRPNLVRGYHFEVLPREVYHALRSWYGEVTPSLCRRTTPQGRVLLYEPNHCPPPASRGLPCSACRSPGAPSKCKRCMSVQYCNRSCQEGHWPYHKAICKNLATNTSSSPENVDTTSNGGEAIPEPPILVDLNGRVGLNNLGNTCFMNSALQCLSHATPLTRHFLSNQFKEDLNADNPLGTGGKLAMAYDATLRELWMKTRGTATSPTALKRAIALFAPRFAGCLQHDSQEFLAYLLDGLHEDLNRIRKAPYVEMPDVTDGHNMAIAGAEAWAAHQRRNESLVMDTFYGQFQSTCVCPKCNRVSVSFDAFNHVSLEIPQVHQQTVNIPILVFRAGVSGDIPFRYGVEVPRHSLVVDLKQRLSDLSGIPVNHMIISDIYEHAIYELFQDKKPIVGIRATDVLAAFEVDPYTNSSIHAVVVHSMKVVNQDDQEQRLQFGFPFIFSFDSESTCQDVWELLWRKVKHMIVQDGSESGFVDSGNKFRPEDVLAMHLTNGKMEPQAAFPSERPNTLSSMLPKNSTAKLQEILGSECTENFLFFAMEWSNPSPEDRLVSPQSFLAYADHKSLIDAVEKQRARNSELGSVTLDQCFETFTKPERLDEKNKWYCSQCKEHVRALKTMKLWRLPNVLVVHLKRFEFKHALRRDKLSTFVTFPLDGLDMEPHCATATAEAENGNPFVDVKVPAEYDLFAVVNHFGRMGFGHYTAFARRWDENGMSNDWALFDDSSVRPVVNGDVQTSVVTPAAYCLFYRRRTFH